MGVAQADEEGGLVCAVEGLDGVLERALTVVGRADYGWGNGLGDRGCACNSRGAR